MALGFLCERMTDELEDVWRLLNLIKEESESVIADENHKDGGGG